MATVPKSNRMGSGRAAGRAESSRRAAFKPSLGGPLRPERRGFVVFLCGVLCVFALVALAWIAFVIHLIDKVAEQDQAQPADAIAVFGAAEYGGRPSPVYHARLDHAVALWQKKIAPLVITLGGGSDKDSGKTEGGVGRDYLLAEGIPYDDIIAETDSFDTRQQAARLAEIAREHNLQHIVVVSDATHLFRIQQLCEMEGLDVYTSPRAPLGHISDGDLAMRYGHEVLSYTAMQLHLDQGWVHRLVVGKDD